MKPKNFLNYPLAVTADVGIGDLDHCLIETELLVLTNHLLQGLLAHSKIFQIILANISKNYSEKQRKWNRKYLPEK